MTEDVITLSFHQSDGSSKRWPMPAQSQPSTRDDEISFLGLAGSDEDGYILWMQRLAAGLATLKGYPKGTRLVLKQLPIGFALFRRHTVSSSAISQRWILYGGISVYERPEQFIPHAFWLLNTDTINPNICGCNCGMCPYSRFLDRTAEAAIVAEKPPFISHLSGSARQSFANFLSNLSSGSPQRKQNALVTGATTLPGDYHMPVLFLPSSNPEVVFHAGEVVWVRVAPSIVDEHLVGLVISWWPGIVESFAEYQLEPQVERQPTCCVQMLGMEARYRVKGSDVVPFQAYVAPPLLLEAIDSLIRTPDFAHVIKSHADGSLPNLFPLPHLQPLGPASIATSSKATSSSSSQPLPPSALPMVYEATFAFAVGLITAYCITGSWDLRGSLYLEDKFGPLKKIESDYRGFWWGAESIVIGDLIRLTHSRTDLAQHFPVTNANASDAVMLSVSHIGRCSTSGRPFVAGKLFELVKATSRWQGLMTLPVPPKGMDFRTITPPNTFAYFDATSIAGRYYAQPPSTTTFPQPDQIPQLCGIQRSTCRLIKVSTRITRGRDSLEEVHKSAIKAFARFVLQQNHVLVVSNY